MLIDFQKYKWVHCYKQDSKKTLDNMLIDEHMNNKEVFRKFIENKIFFIDKIRFG